MDECQAAIVGAAIRAGGWPDLRAGWNQRTESPQGGATMELVPANPIEVLEQALLEGRCLGPQLPVHTTIVFVVGPPLPMAHARTVAVGSVGEALRQAVDMLSRLDIDCTAVLCHDSAGQAVALVLRRPREAWRAELPCYALLALPEKGELPALGMQLCLGDPHPLRAGNGVCWLDRHETSLDAVQQAVLLLELALSVHDRVLPPTRGSGALEAPFAHLAQARPWFGGRDLRPRWALWKDPGAELLLREPLEPPRRFADRWPHEVYLLAAGSRSELLDRIAAVRLAVPKCPHLSDLAYGLAQTAVGTHRLAIVAAGAEALSKALATAAERLADPSCLKLNLASGLFYEEGGQPLSKLAVVIPGQGSQYPDMLADTCLAFPSVQAWFDRFDEQSSPDHPAPSEFLFPIPGAHRDDDPQQLLMGEEGAEAISVSATALSELWCERMGLAPDAIAGYSIGELSALIISGLFEISRHEVVKLMGELTRERWPGGRSNYPSIAVTTGQRELLEQVVRDRPDRLFLALDSCPSQTILSGHSEAVAEATQILRAANATVLPLRFDRGYHTPLYAAKAARIRELYSRIAIGPARIPTYSCIALDWFPSDPEAVRELAVSQWVQPVRFREAAANLHDMGFHVFLEIGPGTRLTGFLRDSLRGRKHKTLSSDAQDRSGLRQLLLSFAQLWVLGYSLRSEALFAERRVAWPQALGPQPPLELPAHGWAPPSPSGNGVPSPLQVGGASPASLWESTPERSPVAPVASSGSPHLDLLRGHLNLMDEFLSHQARMHSLVSGAIPAATAALHPHEALEARGALDLPAGSLPPRGAEQETVPLQDLLGEPAEHQPGQARWSLEFDVRSLPLLRHHTLGGRPAERDSTLLPLPVLPFAFSIELMAQAARRAGQGELLELEEVRGLRWLAVDGPALQLSLKASLDDDGTWSLELHECRGTEQLLACSARARVGAALPPPPPSRELGLEVREGFRISGAAFYSYVFHGPGFQGIRQLTAIGEAGAEAEMVVPDPHLLVRHPSQAHFHSNPVLQDCAGQLVGFWLLERHRLVDIGLYPYRLGRLRRFAPEPPPGSRVLCRAAISFDGRCTRADFDLLHEGMVFARIEEFESRLFRFPPVVFKTLFMLDQSAYMSRPVSLGDYQLSMLSGLDQELFDSSWGIWRRAVAQVVLSGPEREIWPAVPAREGTFWLLRRLAVKDAVRRWASARGVHLLPADIDCGPDGLTLGGQGLELLKPLPRVVVDGAGTFAVAALIPEDWELALVSFEGEPEPAARYAASQVWGGREEDWEVPLPASPKDVVLLERSSPSGEHETARVLLELRAGNRRIALCARPTPNQEGTEHDTESSRDRERYPGNRQGDDRRLGSRA